MSEDRTDQGVAPGGVAKTPGTAGLFSVGHSNHEEQTLLGLLQKQAVEVLADVRSQPYSRYSPHFNSDQIKSALASVGIGYVFLGQELGGRPASQSIGGEEFYDDDGHVLYDRVARSPKFLDGVKRIEAAAGESRLALMCSEENPAECHRHLLVGRVLAQRGVELTHIRGDGRLESHDEVVRRSLGRDADQQFLFAELKEPSWRSIRSVLPRLPPETSLND